jgi:hypothetical protein
MPFQRVVVVEALEDKLVGQLLEDGRSLLREVVDAEGDDPEHRLVSVLAGVARLEDLRPHQLVLQVAVDVIGVFRQHPGRFGGGAKVLVNIRVDDRVRDQLKELADHQGVSLGE